MHRLYICTTCKKREDDVILDELAGETFCNYFVDQYGGRLSGDIDVVPTSCLNACKKACVLALQHPEKYTYVLANMEISDSVDLITLVETYVQKSDGLLKKPNRPEGLRDKVLCRVPSYFQEK